jgi:hypothetical protein
MVKYRLQFAEAMMAEKEIKEEQKSFFYFGSDLFFS